MRILCFLTLLFWSCVLNAATIHWTQFYWNNGTKDALFIPLKFDQLPTTYLMQLDTGASETVFYQIPLRQLEKKLGIVEGSAAPLGIGLSISGYHFDDFEKYDHGLHIQPNFGDKIHWWERHPIIGTIGADMFSDHIVVLDFPGQRIAMMDGNETLPAALAVNATFVPVKFDKQHDWKIFVPLTINGKSYPDDFFYDTGSSEMHIEAANPVWREITGRREDERGVTKFNIWAWGTKEVFVRAPISGQLRIGPVVENHPEAVTEVGGDKYFSQAKFHVLGLFGNAPFYDHYAVIFDLPHSRLGFIREN